MSLGVKFITRQIYYGKHELFVTDRSSAGIQPVIRYDIPVKTAGSKYIDVVLQGGFLFCHAKPFDTAYTDPVTNLFVREHSKNPAYLPIHAGLSTFSRFSIGADLFFWKGLGNRDIWGAKFLSLGYNGKQFRFNVAGEYYCQSGNKKLSGLLLSFDVFVKLIRDPNYR